jgi:adenylosuccinate synthase
VSGLCLTKLDVLDGLDEISICVGYTNDAGETVSNPIDAVDYENLRPVYETLPGWRDSTVGLKSLDALPENARAYIARIEELVGAPIDIISTGPDREDTILLRHPFGG